MSNSSFSLEVSFDDLRRELGRFLGWSRDPNKWSSDQKLDAEDIIRSALRRVYWPTDVNLGQVDHAWSFLESTVELNLNPSQTTYELPDDFEDIVGPWYFRDRAAYGPIKVIPPSMFLQRRSQYRQTGIPMYAAFFANSGTSRRMKWTVMFYPSPSESVVVWARYHISPGVLLDVNSQERKYPLGGPHMAELFVEAVLAVAEEKLMDLPGIHSQQFQLMLASAIKRDGRGNYAETFGDYGDRGNRTEDPSYYLWRLSHTKVTI
ncbi:MAG: hypothetical protein QW761_00170 [Candidatus Aenigmatarchaeota archaeon]